MRSLRVSSACIARNEPDEDPIARILALRDTLSPIAISALDHMKGYASDIQMKTTARYIHVHPAYLSDVFKRETGMTFSTFLSEYRICQAKKLLRQADCKIQWAASQSGFQDQRISAGCSSDPRA